jgi:hypothetical protein
VEKESQLIILSYPLAENFYNSIEFRERILNLLENPGLQLELRFTSGILNSVSKLPTDLNVIGNVRKIHVSSRKVIPRKMDIEDISYDSGCGLDEVSLCRSEDSDRVPACLENYHLLKNLKLLVVRGCQSITDVSRFQSISHLFLPQCCNITDVSSLGKVYELDLSGCESIHDVSALGRVHTLNLNCCQQITDLTALEWVHSLKFEEFQGTDLSGLKNVVNLNICDSPNVSDISILRTVKKLNIRKCPKINDLTGLSSLKDLSLYKHTQITSGREMFLQLSTVESYYDDFVNSAYAGETEKENDEELRALPLWKDSLFLHSLQANLHHLTICGCQSLVEFPYLVGLRSLVIYDCPWLAVFPDIPPSLGYLSISFCENLTVLQIGVGDMHSDNTQKYPLYELKVTDCPNLQKVVLNRKISRCKIMYCWSSKIVVADQQVGRIKTEARYLRKIVNRSKIVDLQLVYCEELEDPTFCFDETRDVLSLDNDNEEGTADFDGEDDDETN